MQVGTLIALSIPASVALGVVFFLILRKWVPALRTIGSPVEHSALRRAENAENELTLANAEIVRLEKANHDLEKERSLAAVIDLVNDVAGGVNQMLAKLAEMNGGMSHTREALAETNRTMQASTRAIELLASQIIIDVTGKGNRS